MLDSDIFFPGEAISAASGRGGLNCTSRPLIGLKYQIFWRNIRCAGKGSMSPWATPKIQYCFRSNLYHTKFVKRAENVGKIPFYKCILLWESATKKSIFRTFCVIVFEMIDVLKKIASYELLFSIIQCNKMEFC